jgi:hypothetical protein
MSAFNEIGRYTSNLDTIDELCEVELRLSRGVKEVETLLPPIRNYPFFAALF